jgi:hypothetical protein
LDFSRSLADRHGMLFARAIGVDYSGAETADSGLTGLRVFIAEGNEEPIEVAPPSGVKRRWTRRTLANWLLERLSEPVPTIAGIDHAFSFPETYFARHGLAHDWDAFLDDFHAHWPTDAPNLYIDFLRHGRSAPADARRGETGWRRRVETICKAKSVFHFDVQGQVAKSTHAGLPFLRRIRRSAPLLHVWPFDGWSIPGGRSALVEAYPKLYSGAYPICGRTPDQHDAYSTARWLRDADRDGLLAEALAPDLSELSLKLASYEGWILGVVADAVHQRRSRTQGSCSRPLTDRNTTAPGYRNRNGQVVIGPTGLPGNDHNQRIYQLCCGSCGLNYGANGSDIHLRKCPNCGGGRPGLAF